MLGFCTQSSGPCSADPSDNPTLTQAQQWQEKQCKMGQQCPCGGVLTSFLWGEGGAGARLNREGTAGESAGREDCRRDKRHS